MFMIKKDTRDCEIFQCSLPGGWVDVLESVRLNTIKEVKEETGLDVIANRIFANQGRNKHNKPIYAYGVCKIFVLCDVVGGKFEENIETTEIKYFSIDELPLLAEEKIIKSKLKCALEHREMKIGK